MIFSARLAETTVMSSNNYHFIDRWRVEGDIKEVADILEDAINLPRWWGSVYFEVKELEKGGERGVGKLISLRAGGWLPYTLRINFRSRVALSVRFLDGRYRRFGRQGYLDLYAER